MPRSIGAATCFVFAVLLGAGPVGADSTPQTLPFSQNWSNAALITTDDVWTGVPGIEGFRGDGLTVANDVDASTVLAANDPGVLDVNADETTPNTNSTGGLGEFAITDPVVAFQGSGTADAPYLRLYLDTTGESSVTVKYTLRDIDSSTDNAAQQVALHYRLGGTGDFTNVPAGYIPDATTGPSLAVLTTEVCVVLPASVNNQSEVQLRIMTTNATGNDEWVGVDDIVVDTEGCDGPLTLSIDDASVTEGDAGTVTASFTVSLSAPAPAGGVSFNIGTEDDTATTADNDYVANNPPGLQTIPEGETEFDFDVTVNGDTNLENSETFLVNVTDVVGATISDGEGVGTIETDDPIITLIHAIQGSGTASPLGNGTQVTVEGVVTASFQSQGAGELRGFFLQEEDLDTDGDDETSEGLFVFCSGCPTAVSEGERVQVTGTIGEFPSGDGTTQLTASTAPAVVVTEAGDHLDEITPATIDLPVPDLVSVGAFYEPLEAMLVTFSDTLTVSEYFELFRYGQIELYDGGRPRQFCADNLPDETNYADHLDALERRRVLLDDDDNIQNVPLTLSETFQHTYHPRQNGGFSSGTQGIDFFRGGDQVSALTGVLHWSGSGQTGTDAWRIRPTEANVTSFAMVNPRPTVAAPSVGGGTITAASMNLLNYFTTIDTTSSNNSGPCGPSTTQDCRGADSVAELARQRARAVHVICTLNADVYAFEELENTTASAAIDDLLTAVNAACGGADPYVFASTAGTLGTDAIRVAIAYRSATLDPQGAPLLDLDAVHNRPPTAQTFEVIEPGNPALGELFTVIANHFKSKSCSGATGLDLDQNDGQGCYNATRTAQANRLLTWITATVLPAAGDDDVLLLGDFNSYALEDPITTLVGGGYTDLMTSLLGSSGYSYLFDGQLGHLDYALASSSLADQVTGIAPWHINADEVPLFDYNDEIRDTGEADFEEKPDGSALAPPRTVFEPGTPYRAADHDPVLVGLFPPPAPEMVPFALAIDDSENDVVELGETVAIQPSWRNEGTAQADNVFGAASNFSGGILTDTAALYGDIAPSVTASCAANANCYAAEMTAGPRPQPHFDVTFDEELTSGETHQWTLHVGESFLDVAKADDHYTEIEIALHRGIVNGCGGGSYCPANPMNREQVALLLMRLLGDPVGACDEIFADVPSSNPFCPYIEELADASRQITMGCGGNNYCPQGPVTREQMAVFVWRALESPPFTPPAGCTEGAEPFTDVDFDSDYCPYIQDLKNRGIVSGCGGGNYCPGSAFTRAPLTTVLKRAFNMSLYSP